MNSCLHHPESSDTLSLYELNNLVRSALEQVLPYCYRVTAEVLEARTATTGHCYLELVEKSAAGEGIIARAAAHIWHRRWQSLCPRFEQVTGRRLTAGMKVLLTVEIDFHEQYGYSLNVVDIDPIYTLGDMARQRQETLRRLADDGVLELNRELPLPRPLSRIAVISSPTAAGYGDFCRQLEQSGYPFHLQLFPALLQGSGVEQSVISALDTIAAERDKWDTVVIIRGGGAVSDLSGFERYELAANIAQFPLPVLTGIGHERDETVADRVAHSAFKTPTAVAAFLIDIRRQEWKLLDELSGQMAIALRRQLTARREQLSALGHQCSGSLLRSLHHHRSRLQAMEKDVQASVRQALALRREDLRTDEKMIRTTTALHLRSARERLALLEKNVALASPQRILRMGFSLTLLNGRAVRDASRLKPGERLTTHFCHGTAESVVTHTDKQSTSSLYG